MGGQKKPTITKLKKMMAKSAKSQKIAEERRKTIFKYNLDSKAEDTIWGYVSKLKYVTPYMITKKFELKLSKSRIVLRRLAEDGKLKLVEKNRELEIYVPIIA